MDQEKLLKLQMQMRHNNDEYQTFLSDMESWTNQLKSKDELIKSSDSDITLPEIRNSCIKKPKIKPPRIKAYDYESWDKFDVDKALQDCVNDDESKVDCKSISNANCSRSIELKEIGNNYFKKGNYQKAVEMYSEALSIDNGNDILLTNRAMAHMKLGNYAAGLADCSLAIAFNSKAVKAFYRRAKCRSFLNESKDDIAADYRAVLSLEPNNKLAVDELRQLMNTRGVVEPLYQQPNNDRKVSKPLIRINIIDVNPNINTSIDQQIEQLSNKTATGYTKPMEMIDNKTTTVARQCTKSPDSQLNPNEINANKSTTNKTRIEFRMPKTALQLAKDLSRFRSNWDYLAQYLIGISCENYSLLIGQQLDSDLLLDLINGLSWAVKYDLLTHDRFVESFTMLSKVSRFSFLWAMITDEEKVHFNDVVSLLDVDLHNKLSGVV